MKVLKFYADWCQPCKMISTMIEQAKDTIKTPIENVNIDSEDNISLCKSYGIRGVPTMILLDDEGKEVRRHVGMATDKQLKTFFGE